MIENVIWWWKTRRVSVRGGVKKVLTEWLNSRRVKISNTNGICGSSTSWTIEVIKTKWCKQCSAHGAIGGKILPRFPKTEYQKVFHNRGVLIDTKFYFRICLCYGWQRRVLIFNSIRLFTAEICMLGVPRLETSDFGHFDLIHRSLNPRVEKKLQKPAVLLEDLCPPKIQRWYTYQPPLRLKIARNIGGG